MKLRALFFGATADTAGAREIEIEIGPGATAGDVVDHVVERFPALGRHSLLFAVNEDYVDRAAILAEGDEIAIFTAVSGG